MSEDLKLEIDNCPYCNCGTYVEKAFNDEYYVICASCCMEGPKDVRELTAISKWNQIAKWIRKGRDNDWHQQKMEAADAGCD